MFFVLQKNSNVLDTEVLMIKEQLKNQKYNMDNYIEMGISDFYIGSNLKKSI